MRRIVSVPWAGATSKRPGSGAAMRISSDRPHAADAINMRHPRSLLRHPGALIITMLAATDLVYRLLLRESLRRALGVGR